MAEQFRALAKLCTGRLRQALLSISEQTQGTILEVRLHTNAPVMLTTMQGMLFLWGNGHTGILRDTAVLTLTQQEMDEQFLALCGYAVHRHGREIGEGYIALPGGHRAGICGRAVRNGDGTLMTVSPVTGLNLRVARFVQDGAKALCEALYRDGLVSVIVAGPPVSGKTTMLRDLARRLSQGLCGTYYRVSVMDSRQEFGVLPFCDVLVGFNKAEGIAAALRAMAPQMIVCDEVTTGAQVRALESGFSAGVECAVSIHASGVEQLRRREAFRCLARTGQFSHVVLLRPDGLCRIDKIVPMEELLCDG